MCANDRSRDLHYTQVPCHFLSAGTLQLSKDGEDHKLGDVAITPLDLHTLGLHTSNFCFSIETFYHINLECPFICFGLIFVFVRPPHYHLYMKKFLEIWVEICWMLL